jgi:hypothetical protein
MADQTYNKVDLAREQLDDAISLMPIAPAVGRGWHGEGRRTSTMGPSGLLFWTFRRGDPLAVTTHAVARLLVQIAPRGSSIAQGLFNAGHVFAEPNQNQFALCAARHFGAKQLKDEWIGRLANSPDRCVGSLSFQATQASAIDKRLWILAYGSTTKLGNSVAGQAQND